MTLVQSTKAHGCLVSPKHQKIMDMKWPAFYSEQETPHDIARARDTGHACMGMEWLLSLETVLAQWPLITQSEIIEVTKLPAPKDSEQYEAKSTIGVQK